jgi:hypothetical protein
VGAVLVESATDIEDPFRLASAFECTGWDIATALWDPPHFSGINICQNPVGSILDFLAVIANIAIALDNFAWMYALQAIFDLTDIELPNSTVTVDHRF